MLSDRIYKKILDLDLNHTQEVFEFAILAYQENNPTFLNAKINARTRIPKLSGINFRLDFLRFLVDDQNPFRKYGFKYSVIYSLLSGDLQDTEIPLLEQAIKTVTVRLNEHLTGLPTAVIDDLPNKVNALMSLGANPFKLDKYNASAAGLALSLKNNNCYTTIKSHRYFIHFMTTPDEILQFINTAIDTDHLNEIKDIYKIARESEIDSLSILIPLILIDTCSEKLPHQAKIQQLLIELGFKAPDINTPINDSTPPKKTSSLPTNFHNEILTVTSNISAPGNTRVYRGVWLSEPVAIKLFATKSKLTDECSIHKRLRHPKIIQYYENYSVSNEYFLLIMELADCGSLYDNIIKGNYNDTTAVQWLLHVAAALYYLHENEFVHCDIKPDNILITSDQVAKLADFGLTFHLSSLSDPLHTTPKYSAPEIRDYTIGNNARPIDIYAFGLVMYETLLKKPAWYQDIFYAKNKINTFFSAVAAGMRPPQKDLSDDRYKLMQDCWQDDPSKRPTAQNIIPRLK